MKIKYKSKSIANKLAMIVSIVLIISFIISTIYTRLIIKDEILTQWKEQNLKLVNVYSQMIEMDDLQGFIDKIDSENDLAYALFINTDLVAIAHNNPDRIGITLDDEGSIATAKYGEEYSDFFTWSVTNSLVLDVLTPIYVDDILVGGLNLGIKVDDDTVNSILRDTLSKLLVFFIMSCVLTIFILFLFVKTIVVKPIVNLSNIIEKLANYDLTLTNDENNYLKRKDEIGDISNSLYKMQTNLVDLINKIRNLSNDITTNSKELNENTNVSTKIAEEISKAIEEISNGATEQAKNTEQGADNIVELGYIIEENRKCLDNLNVHVNEIVLLQKEGVDILDDTLRKSNEINLSSKEVYDIVLNANKSAGKIEIVSDTIKNIATQTNLLALNARIESAKAGKFGNGFSVIADEIKKLAEQSQNSTIEIEKVVKELMVRTLKAVETMKEVEVMVSSQTNSVNLTSEKFNEINNTIEIIKTNILETNNLGSKMEKKKDEVIDIIQNLSSISQENAAATEECFASIEEQTSFIEEISDASGNLEKIANVIDVEIGRFKV